MTAPREETRIVPVTLPDGSEILAEVVVGRTGGDARTNRGLYLESVREDIARIGRFLADVVHEALPDPPDKYGIDFGLKLTVESKGLTSVLAKVAGEATVTVRMEWDRRDPPVTLPECSAEPAPPGS
jgi:hypothetical protein